MSRLSSLCYPVAVSLTLLSGSLGAFADEVVIDGRKILFNRAHLEIITPTSYIASPCMGNLLTPLCAIRTLIGCGHYVWNPACAAMNSNVYKSEDIRIEYVILEAGPVNTDRVAAVLRNDSVSAEAGEESDFGIYPWLTADAFQARVIERTCTVKQTSCDHVTWRESIYTVSPHKGIWIFSMYGLFRPEDWFIE
ncbi:MAG: hypothetical protein WCF16_06250 [Alphaproteobacteria bacterium]